MKQLLVVALLVLSCLCFEVAAQQRLEPQSGVSDYEPYRAALDKKLLKFVLPFRQNQLFTMICRKGHLSM